VRSRQAWRDVLSSMAQNHGYWYSVDLELGKSVTVPNLCNSNFSYTVIPMLVVSQWQLLTWD